MTVLSHILRLLSLSLYCITFFLQFFFHSNPISVWFESRYEWFYLVQRDRGGLIKILNFLYQRHVQIFNDGTN